AGRKEGGWKRGKYSARQRRRTDARMAELWTRRAAGEPVTRIARHLGRYVKSVRSYIHDAASCSPVGSSDVGPPTNRAAETSTADARARPRIRPRRSSPGSAW